MRRHHHFNDFIRRIYALQDMETLRETISFGILKVVGGDNAGTGEVCLKKAPTVVAGTIAHSFTSNHFSDVVRDHLSELPVYRWLSDTRHTGAHAYSEAITRSQLHRTTVYNEGFKPEGVEDALEAEVGRNRTRLMSIAVFRSSRRCSQRDLQTFTDLLPHLEQAVANARRFAPFGGPRSLLASLEAGLDTGLILLNREGTIVHCSEETRSILWRCFPSHTDPRSTLPLELRRWVRKQIRLRESGITAPSFPKAVFGHSLEVSLSGESDTGYYLLMVSETKPASTLASFGLTPREIEVLHWIAEGKTNDEIATILDVSFFTIKTQVKSIFRRLGVETRTAAAAMILRERQVAQPS